MHGGPYKMAADSGIIFKDTLFGRMSHKGKTSAACWQPVAFLIRLLLLSVTMANKYFI